MSASSEERLLKLIKGEYKKKKKFKASLPISSRRKAPEPVFFKRLNLILRIVLICSLGYLVYEFIPRQNTSDKSKAGVLSAPASGPAIKPALKRIADYSVYSKALAGKNLFSSSDSSKAKRAKAPAMDVSKRFSLVGIIAGEKPQAIIEDKDNSKTYYLYEGEAFSGVVIESIQKGKAVIDYNGQNIILVL